VPEQLGMPSGAEIKYITFSVVLFSILICSIMILLIEKQPKMNVFFRFVFRSHFKRKPKDSKPLETNVEE
jgi:hypothetical protein